MQRNSNLIGQFDARREHRRYYLARSTAADLHLLNDILAFIRWNCDRQVIERSSNVIEDHIRRGELIILSTDGLNGREITGLMISALSDDASPMLEIASAVVRKAHRGRRLAKILASGAIIGQAVNQADFSAIILTCHPDNIPCQKAADKLGVDITEANALLGSIASLDDLIRHRRAVYWSLNWRTEPLVGIVRPNAVQEGAQLILNAARKEGLAWYGNSRIFLQGEWCRGHDPDGEGALCVVRGIADGLVPPVELWKHRKDKGFNRVRMAG